MVREIAVVGPATGMSKDLTGELRNLVRREPEACASAGVSEREGNGGRDNGDEVVDGGGGSFGSCVHHAKGDIHDLGN